jgi:hypothetical protein
MAIYREIFTQDLSSSACNVSRAFVEDVYLNAVMISVSTDISESVKVIFDSLDGSSYDVELDNSELTDNRNYVFIPSGRLVIKEGDMVKVVVSNANTIGVIYGTILCETIP